MMREGEHLESLVAEYADLLRQCIGSESTAAVANFSLLVNALSQHAEWSHRGASEIVHLATGYGAFMLRNAFALAIALGKEDGELGF